MTTSQMRDTGGARPIGRPREFDEDRTLADLMTVFWRRGYGGSSLSDLMEATGLMKGSLYGAFGDKREMYLRALARYVDGNVAELAAQLSGTPPAEGLRMLLDAPIRGRRSGDLKGCFLCNAALDRAHEDADAAAIVRRGFASIGCMLVDLLGRLDPLRDEDRIRREADLLLAAYSGLRVFERTLMPEVEMERMRDAALHAVGAPQAED
ncbi:TetR family transcriptional regulator [bacterium]|nr:TetR family transcriptional regulator [bacterium]